MNIGRVSNYKNKNNLAERFIKKCLIIKGREYERLLRFYLDYFDILY